MSVWLIPGWYSLCAGGKASVTFTQTFGLFLFFSERSQEKGPLKSCAHIEDSQFLMQVGGMGAPEGSSVGATAEAGRRGLSTGRARPPPECAAPRILELALTLHDGYGLEAATTQQDSATSWGSNIFGDLELLKMPCTVSTLTKKPLLHEKRFKWLLYQSS